MIAMSMAMAMTMAMEMAMAKYDGNGNDNGNQMQVGDPQYPVRCTTAIPELSPGRRWTGVNRILNFFLIKFLSTYKLG